jgi:hypothetical protein
MYSIRCTSTLLVLVIVLLYIIVSSVPQVRNERGTHSHELLLHLMRLMEAYANRHGQCHMR